MGDPPKCSICRPILGHVIGGGEPPGVAAIWVFQLPDHRSFLAVVEEEAEPDPVGNPHMPQSLGSHSTGVTDGGELVTQIATSLWVKPDVKPNADSAVRSRDGAPRFDDLLRPHDPRHDLDLPG